MPVAGQLLPDDSAEGTDGPDFPPVTCQAEQVKDLFCCGARADARALSNMKERLCWEEGVCVCGWLCFVVFVFWWFCVLLFGFGGVFGGVFWFVFFCGGVVLVFLLLALGIGGNLQGSWCKGRNAHPLSPRSVKLPECESTACPLPAFWV